MVNIVKKAKNCIEQRWWIMFVPKMQGVAFVYFFLGIYSVVCKTRSRPNIIVILADDTGHADIGYSEGNLQAATDFIDKLAYDGVIMDRMYTNPICSPSRATLLTGKYTIHTGMQTEAIGPGQPWGLPTHFKLLPQFLKDLGYYTCLLGKWHLGSFTRAHWPNQRDLITGWDSHKATPTISTTQPLNARGAKNVFQHGRDLFENGKKLPAHVMNNHFLPDLLVEKAEQVIRTADPARPFFLMFSTPLTRLSDDYGKGVQYAMSRYLQKAPLRFLNDRWHKRKSQLAAIATLDDHVKRIYDALKHKGPDVLTNTIILFMNDNGGTDMGAPNKNHVNHASNWPLRMGKLSLFEGGVRVPCFLWSKSLKKRGYIARRLMHMSDWLPTLYEAAGGRLVDLASFNITGVSHWSRFRKGTDRPVRKELVNNIDPLANFYAMIEERQGRLYKLIGGNPYGRTIPTWHRTEGTTELNPMKKWTPTSIECLHTPGVEMTACIPWVANCLYDVTADPCEQQNIAAIAPRILHRMEKKLATYNQTAVPAEFRVYEPASAPDKWGGWWAPWRDPNPHLDEVTYQPFESPYQ